VTAAKWIGEAVEEDGRFGNHDETQRLNNELEEQ
jgi:hypothetical protein